MLEQDRWLHSMFLDCITLLLWILGLAFLIYQFHAFKTSISKFLKISSIFLFVAYIMAWIMLIILDIAGYMFYVDYVEKDVFNIKIWKFYRSTSIIFCLIYFPLPCASFYLFILARLRISFKDTVYAVPRIYFIVIGTIGALSLVLRTWAVLFFDVYIYYWYPNYPISDHLDNFRKFCLKQFYIIDPLIRLIVIYSFNRRLFKLIVLQREDLSNVDDAASQRDSISSELNDRQSKLVNTITKHTLLICILVIEGLIWAIWIEVGLSDSTGDADVITVFGDYLFFILSILQLICIYLGFGFAKAWYSRCCSSAHGLCETCCQKIALRKITKDVTKEYKLLDTKEEDSQL